MRHRNREGSRFRARRVAIGGTAALMLLTGEAGAQSVNAPPVLQDSSAGSPQSRAATTPLPAPPPPDHLFGDWDGFRSRLAKQGITFTLNLTNESAGVVSGGLKRGATDAGQVALSVDLDWQTIATIQGLKTHAIFVSRFGGNVSPSYVGDTVLQAQEIYGAIFDQPARLVWLYNEQSLLNDRLKIYYGRFAPGLDDAASPLYCSFMTLTICGHPRALTANQGFEDWPLSEWGGEVKGRLTDQTYLSVGLFQSQPFPTSQHPYTEGGLNGFSFTFRDTTGVSVPVELGYEPLVGAAKLPGHYKIGANYDSSNYPDNFYDRNNNPVALTALTGRMHGGRYQFWATADQLVYQNGPYSDDGLYLLGAYVKDDPDTSFFNNFVWAGLIDRGVVPGRPLDQLGAGFTYFDVSPRLTRTENLEKDVGLPLAGDARGVQTHGFVYELNYGIHASQGVLVQPELEYFSRPGGVSNVPGAFLVGLKTNVDF